MALFHRHENVSMSCFRRCRRGVFKKKTYMKTKKASACFKTNCFRPHTSKSTSNHLPLGLMFNIFCNNKWIQFFTKKIFYMPSLLNVRKKVSSYCLNKRFTASVNLKDNKLILGYWRFPSCLQWKCLGRKTISY